jgi:hypothetical protein
MAGNQQREYTPEMSGSGQIGICSKCRLPPSEEGHDGCLGELEDPLIMNACCGHGDTDLAYIQYWDGRRISGERAVYEQGLIIKQRRE